VVEHHSIAADLDLILDEEAAGEVFEINNGGIVKVIAGRHAGLVGPAAGIPVDPTYLDIQLPAGAKFQREIHPGYTAFAQVIDGQGRFSPAASDDSTKGETVVYADGPGVEITAGDQGVRFLMVSGRPLHEPIAWYGPIVMNTKDEIAQAALELRRGDFIKNPKKVIVEE
jgi:quercetin 2,3-dioxygenase